MVQAFESIFKIYKPAEIQTDEGKEFTNKHVQDLFKKYMVRWFVAKNERIKCSMVERFQRTLMTRIHKYLTSTGAQSFITELPRFIAAYNNTHHRTIRMTPNEAVKAPESRVFKIIYGFENERALLKNMYAQPNLKAGTKVRIPAQKSTFEKGYTTNFTDEIYSIDKGITSLSRPVYRLKTHAGKVIKGNFYPEEVQQIQKGDVYRIQILEERKVGRGKQYLVHYVNFPDSENEWISGTKLKQLTQKLS